MRFRFQIICKQLFKFFLPFKEEGEGGGGGGTGVSIKQKWSFPFKTVDSQFHLTMSYTFLASIFVFSSRPRNTIPHKFINYIHISLPSVFKNYNVLLPQH